MELIDILNEIVKSFNEEYSVVEGEEYSATLSTYVITYTPDTFLIRLLLYTRRCTVEVGIEMPFLNPMTCSLLHEIGHLETEELMVDDTQLRNEYENSNEGAQESFARYCELYNEQIATQWAIFYILDNKEQVKEWDKRLRLSLPRG